MKVLMLGWEFPPFISGGLGTACYGLTRALSEQGTEVLFVLPRPVPSTHTQHVRLLSPSEVLSAGTKVSRRLLREFEHVRFWAVDAVMYPYGEAVDVKEGEQTEIKDREELLKLTEEVRRRRVKAGMGEARPGIDYAGDMFTETERYAELALEIAELNEFDVIHAHDWMTYRAGMAVAQFTGKPLVVHVHSTEFDRSGEHVNQRIYDIERAGMHAASRVITVSYLTRSIAITRYGVDPAKVRVVYNAIDRNGSPAQVIPRIRRDEKIVLFLGRITMQKGPEYFVRAAQKVLSVLDNVRFIMAGSGDMARRSIELAAELGIGHKVLFTGFLRGPDVERVFRMADLYVMPSVSEPFGIAPLEAINQEVPVLISKQSGVSEILTHALKVDFWDVDEIANKIIAVLRHPPLHSTLRQHSTIEVSQLNWSTAATGCLDVYREMAGAV